MKILYKKIISVLMFGFVVSFVNGVVSAADKMVFDSTDNYLGACSLTNKSEWILKDPLNVTTFEIWYSWNQGETELPVKVFKDGTAFAEFVATRGNCDPYQHQWCNADYKINKLFPAGKYTTEIPTSRQCLKPGGTGAVRLYIADSSQENLQEGKVVETSVTAPLATPPVNNGAPPPPVPSTVTASQPAPIVPSQCACESKTIVVTAAVTSLITSVIVGMLLKKK